MNKLTVYKENINYYFIITDATYIFDIGTETFIKVSEAIEKLPIDILILTYK